MVVEAWLHRAAAARPELTAVQTPSGSWSYSELLAAAQLRAGDLAERGVCRGERVAIALKPGLAFAQALHACMLLGAVAAPIDLRMSAGERRRIAKGAVVVLDDSTALRGRAGDMATDAAAGGHELDATAVVIHTSGTSSAPKPVELTYGNLLWSALGSTVALGLNPDERWLCALPLSHIGGLSILVRSAIYGATAVIHERFETERVLHALQEEGITLVSLVATTLARLLDAGLEHPPALRCALTGGGPVPAALVARAAEAGVPVSMTYGLTESCSQVTTTPVALIAQGDHDAGPPLFCTRVRRAQDGEVFVAGPTVAPGATADDGWLHTGDLGSFDVRGGLWITGRKADTIVSGGENVAPSEVEAVLETHPDVLEAAVVGRPDAQWGEAVTAIVVLREGALAEGTAKKRDDGAPGVGGERPKARVERTGAYDDASLRAHCAAALAPYKVPKRILLRAEPLPRTRSGKLLRREL